MLMDQGLGLIAFQLAQIVRITLEITALQQWPVNPPQIAKVDIEIGPLVIGMAIGKHKRQPQFSHAMQAGNQDQDFIIFTLGNTAP